MAHSDYLSQFVAWQSYWRRGKNSKKCEQGSAYVPVHCADSAQLPSPWASRFRVTLLNQWTQGRVHGWCSTGQSSLVLCRVGFTPTRNNACFSTMFPRYWTAHRDALPNSSTWHSDCLSRLKHTHTKDAKTYLAYPFTNQHPGGWRPMENEALGSAAYMSRAKILRTTKLGTKPPQTVLSSRRSVVVWPQQLFQGLLCSRKVSLHWCRRLQSPVLWGFVFVFVFIVLGFCVKFTPQNVFEVGDFVGLSIIWLQLQSTHTKATC